MEEKRVHLNVHAEELLEMYLDHVREVLENAPMDDAAKDFYMLSTKLIFKDFLRETAEKIAKEETNSEA